MSHQSLLCLALALCVIVVQQVFLLKPGWLPLHSSFARLFNSSISVKQQSVTTKDNVEGFSKKNATLHTGKTLNMATNATNKYRSAAFDPVHVKEKSKLLLDPDCAPCKQFRSSTGVSIRTIECFQENWGAPSDWDSCAKRDLHVMADANNHTPKFDSTATTVF